MAAKTNIPYADEIALLTLPIGASPILLTGSEWEATAV